MFNLGVTAPNNPLKIREKSAQLAIVSLDGPLQYIYAQYYPKEISIDKNIPWNKHSNPKGNSPMLEFTSAENRTLSLELFFDYFESDGSVTDDVKALTGLTMINESATEDKDKHPPMVMVVFGGGEWMRGVIESLGVKYTMFNQEGSPVRATCSVKIKETSQAEGK